MELLRNLRRVRSEIMARSRLKKKYQGPKLLWESNRMQEEAQLKKEYAYKNKKEVWKMFSVLRNFRAQARKLIGSRTKESEALKAQLMKRLNSLGLIKLDAKLEDILNLTIRDIMERRLQTLVYKKGMAKSMKQARQFITHGHILIGDKKVKSPSHLTTVEEEKMIRFDPNSPLANELHPARKVEKVGEINEQAKG